MSSIAIMVKSEESATHIAQKYKLGANCLKQEPEALSQLFKNIASGNQRAVIEVNHSSDNPVAASFTATLVSCATDTLTIGGITFTGSSNPSGDVQFETDGSDSADATALAAEINAHPTISKIVVAEASNNVVTVTCRVKGVIGNFIPVSESGSTITLAGITAGFMTSGTGGATETASSYALGIS